MKWGKGKGKGKGKGYSGLKVGGRMFFLLGMLRALE
jgi:hypothetical protein